MSVRVPPAPLPRRTAPPLAAVRQLFPTNHVEDVRADVRQRLIAAGLPRTVSRGARIAITAGSRGIGGIVDLLAGIADAVKAAGAVPVIVPAMGSHGGATAGGQRDILRRLGVTEAAVGAPVEATMDTVAVGAAANGAVAHVDEFAMQCDGIIVLGRTKTHPESAADLASGLLKMCTIGLGKQRGAQEAHSHGLWPSVLDVPRVQLARAPVRFGVAVVENAYRQPLAIEVVPPVWEAFLNADRRLLPLAKAHLPTLPFNRLDLLIVDELGKTISGAGMDPNIIGHWRNSDGPHVPDFRRIVVLSLTHGSLGNGLGIGMADFTTVRFASAYDPQVSYMNLLTASEPGGNTREGPLPLALPSDRDAIEVALYSALAGDDPRVCRITSTAALDRFLVSPALVETVRQNPRLELLSTAVPLPFDAAGNLPLASED